MVFVKDFRKSFYDVLLQKRILVLVAVDVDAVCACKILQYLFQCDHILYTIVPVAGKNDLEQAFIENNQGIKYVLLINCGATEDIVELLQPEPHVIFFICDSHRPIDVHNVYNQVQVQLLIPEDDNDKIPEFETVFREESSDDEDDDGDEAKRRRIDEAAIEKRIERRGWEEKRRQILFKYEEFAFHGPSAAFLMYELAWKMSKDTNDLLWLAIIGVTEQFLMNLIDRDHYMDRVRDLRGHVQRLNVRAEDDDGSINSLRLSFQQVLNLNLYRHWTVLDSLTHSPLFTSRFKLWTLRGRKKLHEFLADMGLPLAQSKQRFSSMDIMYKEQFKDMMQAHMEKYGITEEEMFLSSFTAQFGYRHLYSAGDMVLACQAMFEQKTSTNTDSFLVAQDVLTRRKTDVLVSGLDAAKTQLKAIVQQVQTFIDTHQIISAGPYIYAFVQENTPDSKFFSTPIGVSRLARFTLEAFVAVGRGRNLQKLPLVLGVPLGEDQATLLVTGIPPASDELCQNCFGKAFEQAAAQTSSRILADSFQANIIELKSDDKAKFFDALMSLLQ